MKKRKIFLGLLVATASVIAVAGCTSKKDSNDDADKASDASGDGEGQGGGGGTQTEKVTVTFNSNGGTNVTSIEVDKGGKVEKPADPSKAKQGDTRYEFDGWYKDSSLSIPFNFATDTVSTNTTLYAKWNAISDAPSTTTYYVVFNTNGGSTVTNQQVEAGHAATKPADPTKVAADDKHVEVFDGWYKDQTFKEEYDFNTPVNGATLLYAKWVTYEKIETKDEFLAFRQLEAASGAYLLTADIDLEGVEIEAPKNVFTGIFNGDGHTISNGIYTTNASNKTGFFVKELRGGTITDVRFENCVASLAGETISVIAGLGSGNITVSKVQFNGCSSSAQSYGGIIIGRIDSAKTVVNLSELTFKNGCSSTSGNYGGFLISDTDKADAGTRTVINITDCDIDGELAGTNGNGGFLSGRLRSNTNLNIKNVVIRNAILPSTTGLICGGGSNNATNSTVTVENLYVMNTNAELLQSCAVANATNPVTTFSITYTNSYMAATPLAKITDNTVNGTTYLTSVDPTTTDVNWLDNTLKLDFENEWTTEENDATKYRLTASSTNVKSANATIKRLKVTTANAPLRFEQGTEFSYAGLAVTGVYSDGVNLVLKPETEYEVISTNFNKDVAGKYTITVASTEDPTVTATYEVEVVELLSFEVDTNYAKVTYMVGEKLALDKDGNYVNLLVYGNWSDGKRLLLPVKAYTTNLSTLDLSTAGAKDLVVSIEGQTDAHVRISVVDTKPIVVDNYAYVNVDADADVTYAGERVNGVETFNTINEALEYLISANLGADVNKVIYVADGTYHEKLTISSKLANLKIVGESRDNTIIEYDAVEDTVDPISGVKFTMNCATLHVKAEDFGLENITVKNSFDYIKDHNKYGNPQGFALTIEADRAVIDNVTLYGNQDTLFFKKGRVYLTNSEIQGNIDFIFGENDGIAFFDQCTIKALNKSTTQEKNNGYVTAMKGDKTNHPTYGYVFYKCNFTDDGTLLDGSMSLGRPWGAGASVAMIQCEFSAAYSTLGYDGSSKSRWYDMSGNKPGDAHFVEYGSTGDGAIEEAVAGGSILTADEAGNYTAANTLAPSNGGVSWNNVVFDYQGALTALRGAKDKVDATAILAYLDGTLVDNSMTIAKEDTSILALTAAEWNANNKDVEVTIGDPTLATYANGKITGLEIGNTTITFTLGSVTKTVTLEVIELPSYDVTFVVPTGATAVSSQSVKKNKKVEVPTAPTLEGSVFKGWFTDEACTEEYDFNTPVTGEVTLYARFVAWADLTKENCVYYFNGTEGDGVDSFGDGINIQKKEGVWYSISVGGDTSANKIQSRWNNSDPSKVNPDSQFNTNTTLSFAVEKNATITVTFRSLNGALILYTFNGEAITPTVSADGNTFTYEATSAGVFKMENNADSTVGAAKNSYLSSIAVTYPEVISKTTKVSFGTTGNYTEVLGMDYTAANFGEIKEKHNQIAGTVVFYVEENATISIAGNWAIDFTINGGERIQSANAGGTYTSTNYEYFCAEGGKVVIQAGSNKNYFYSITVTYPAKIENDLTISFATGGNGYGTIDGVAFNCEVVDHNGDGSAQVKNGTITLSLKAAAKVTITANWGLDIKIGDTEYKNANAGGTYDGTVVEYNASAGDLVITMGDSGKNYIKTIKIEY